MSFAHASSPLSTDRAHSQFFLMDISFDFLLLLPLSLVAQGATPIKTIQTCLSGPRHLFSSLFPSLHPCLLRLLILCLPSPCTCFAFRPKHYTKQNLHTCLARTPPSILLSSALFFLLILHHPAPSLPPSPPRTLHQTKISKLVLRDSHLQFRFLLPSFCCSFSVILLLLLPPWPPAQVPTPNKFSELVLREPILQFFLSLALLCCLSFITLLGPYLSGSRGEGF